MSTNLPALKAAGQTQLVTYSTSLPTGGVDGDYWWPGPSTAPGVYRKVSGTWVLILSAIGSTFDRWRGAWSSGTTYNAGDMVVRSGQIYVCITPNSDATFVVNKWIHTGTGGEPADGSIDSDKLDAAVRAAIDGAVQIGSVSIDADTGIISMASDGGTTKDITVRQVPRIQPSDANRVLKVDSGGTTSDWRDDADTTDTTELSVLSAVPAITDYTDGDIINVNGDLYVLTDDTDNSNVVNAIASAVSGSYEGAGSGYGTWTDPALAGKLEFDWSTDPDANIPKARFRVAKSILATAPTGLWIRLEAGPELREVTDFQFTRDTGRDTSAFWAFVAPTTGPASAASAPTAFRISVFTDAAFTTGAVIHTVERWESYINAKGGGLTEDEVKAEIRPEAQVDVATLTPTQQTAARTRINAAEEGSGLTEAQVKAEIRPEAQVDVPTLTETQQEEARTRINAAEVGSLGGGGGTAALTLDLLVTSPALNTALRAGNQGQNGPWAINASAPAEVRPTRSWSISGIPNFELPADPPSNTVGIQFVVETGGVVTYRSSPFPWGMPWDDSAAGSVVSPAGHLRLSTSDTQHVNIFVTPSVSPNRNRVRYSLLGGGSTSPANTVVKVYALRVAASRSAFLRSDSPDADVDITTPAGSSTGGWSAWTDLADLTAISATEAGQVLLLGEVHGESQTASTSGGQRIHVESRLIRIRGSETTSLSDHVDYLRRVNASGSTSTNFAATSLMSDEELATLTEAEEGDVYKLQARVEQQVTSGVGTVVRFNTTRNKIIVSPIGGVRGADGADGAAGDASKLAVLAAVPAIAGYNAGDIIDVAGVLKVLVANDDNSNVAYADVSAVNGLFTGAGATYGTWSDPALASTLAFEWATYPKLGSTVNAKFMIAKSVLATAPGNLYIRLTNGPRLREVTKMIFNRDAGSDTSTHWAYTTDTTGIESEGAAPTPFRIEVFSNAMFTTSVDIHAAARWEPWLKTHPITSGEVDATTVLQRDEWRRVLEAAPSFATTNRWTYLQDLSYTRAQLRRIIGDGTNPRGLATNGTYYWIADIAGTDVIWGVLILGNQNAGRSSSQIVPSFSLTSTALDLAFGTGRQLGALTVHDDTLYVADTRSRGSTGIKAWTITDAGLARNADRDIPAATVTGLAAGIDVEGMASGGRYIYLADFAGKQVFCLDPHANPVVAVPSRHIATSKLNDIRTDFILQAIAADADGVWAFHRGSPGEGYYFRLPSGDRDTGKDLSSRFLAQSIAQDLTITGFIAGAVYHDGVMNITASGPDKLIVFRREPGVASNEDIDTTLPRDYGDYDSPFSQRSVTRAIDEIVRDGGTVWGPNTNFDAASGAQPNANQYRRAAPRRLDLDPPTVSERNTLLASKGVRLNNVVYPVAAVGYGSGIALSHHTIAGGANASISAFATQDAARGLYRLTTSDVTGLTVGSIVRFSNVRGGTQSLENLDRYRVAAVDTVANTFDVYSDTVLSGLPGFNAGWHQVLVEQSAPTSDYTVTSVASMGGAGFQFARLTMSGSPPLKGAVLTFSNITGVLSGFLPVWRRGSNYVDVRGPMTTIALGSAHATRVSLHTNKDLPATLPDPLPISWQDTLVSSRNVTSLARAEGESSRFARQISLFRAATSVVAAGAPSGGFGGGMWNPSIGDPWVTNPGEVTVPSGQHLIQAVTEFRPTSFGWTGGPWAIYLADGNTVQWAETRDGPWFANRTAARQWTRHQDPLTGNWDAAIYTGTAPQRWTQLVHVQNFQPSNFATGGPTTPWTFRFSSPWNIGATPFIVFDLTLRTAAGVDKGRYTMNMRPRMQVAPNSNRATLRWSAAEEFSMEMGDSRNRFAVKDLQFSAQGTSENEFGMVAKFRASASDATMAEFLDIHFMLYRSQKFHLFISAFGGE